MLVNKDKRLKNKAMKDYYDNARICSICRKSIAQYDVISGNFEYTKSKQGEQFVHTSCVNKMIKHN